MSKRLAYEVRIEIANRTIVVTGTGAATTADTIQLIADQQHAFLEHPGFNLLYDSSQMDIESSPADMLKVAKALFEDTKTTFGRIALVVPESRMALAAIFSALANPHGISANVFTHTADARRWLGITS